MKPLNVFYPDFVPNQVLTNTQLNQLRDYLDQENRLTRVRTTGCGIVCGMYWSADSFSVSGGYGITSDGYLIHLDATTYTHKRSYIDPDNQDGVPAYAPWRDVGNVQVNLTALVSEAEMAEAPPADATPLTATDLSGHLVVAYLELEDVELNSCLVTDCDNKGLNVNLNCRLLLVESGVFTAPDPAPALPPTPYPPRLPTEQPLIGIGSGADINQAYARIVTGFATPISEAILDVAATFSPLLGLDGLDLTPIEGLQDAMNSAQADGRITQYHFDFMKDLAAAHQEFVDIACHLVPVCCPQSLYPRHLMLGNGDGAPGRRHTFQAAAAHNVRDHSLNLARHLLERVIALTAEFTEGGLDIRMTPSHAETHKLGARALPFYYGFSEPLRSRWQPRDPCTTQALWSWHSDSHDLLRDYTRASLIRVEGHVGNRRDDARDAISGLRTRLNLEFDLLMLPLTLDDSEERAAANALTAALALLEDEQRGQRRFHAELTSDPSAIDKDAIKKIAEVRQRVQDVRQGVVAAHSDLTAIRCRGDRFCDPGDLETQYQTLRARLIGELNLLAGRFGGIPQLSVPLDENSAHPELDIQIMLSAGCLRDALKLVLSLLPQRLCGFDALPVRDPDERAFARVFSAMLADMADLSLGITARINVATGPTVSFLHPAYTALDWGSGEDSFEFARNLQNCVAQALGVIAAHVAAMPRVFSELARARDGMEHRAGVEPGGTFILVTETDAPDAPVVADFALSGQLSCCCPPLDRMCLPPVAPPIYLTIPMRDQRMPVQTGIDLGARAYDPNNPDAELKFGLVSETSELDGNLVFDGNTLVAYSNKQAIAGTVDRFTYRLHSRSDNCEGEAAGSVLILMQPPAPVDVAAGTITGVVRDAESGKPVAEANVNIDLLDRGERTDRRGEFTFTRVPVGSFPVQAVFGGFQSNIVTVDLGPGEGAQIELLLDMRPDNTAIEVSIADAKTGEGVLDVTTRIGSREDPDSVREQFSPGLSSLHIFNAVAPGTYLVEAGAPGYLVSRAEITVSAGETGRSSLQMARSAVAGNARGPLIDSLSASRNSNREDVAASVDKQFSAREAERLERVALALEDPAVRRNAGAVAASDFISATVADPERDTAALTAEFAGLGKTLAGTARRSKEPRALAYREVVSLAARSLLDRIVLKGELDGATGDALAALPAQFDASGIDIAAIATGWRDGLADVGELEVVNQMMTRLA